MFEPDPLARVFGLAPGVDFPRAVIDGLVARMEGQPPEAMARVHLVVNTRRMARRMQAMFDAGPTRLLPRISLVTDLSALPGAPVLPPAVLPLRRRLELVGLVSRLLEADPTLAPRSSLYGLADSLASLMEEMSGEGVTADCLRNLDVTDQSGHWERALSFFNIAQAYIDQVGGPPESEARNRAIVEALAQWWETAPPDAPILLAGSTGSRGATNLLMQAVARLPNGAVILPGFDFDMPSRTWDRLDAALSGEDHPQFRFGTFLKAVGSAPADVAPWQEVSAPCPARNRLVSLALRPAPVTHEWRNEGPHLSDLSGATAGLTLLEAPSDRAEALAIALRLRQAAEDGQIAALITPNRMLTRQVTAALDRWNILPDDSAGTPLQLSPPGRFLRQIAEMGRGPVTAEALLSLLKHPLTHSGADRGDHLLRTRDLELWMRRAGPPFPDADDIRRGAGAIDAPDAWTDWLTAIVAACVVPESAALADRLDALLRFAETVTAGSAADGSGGLWDEKAGREARALMTALVAEADAGGAISAGDFADLLGAVLSTKDVRDRDAPHPNILIWGTLEARVQGADLMILAGLNDGSWPETPPPDPWLNRALRNQAGLLLPDRRIGLAAHDFQQAVAAKEVWLTRAIRSDDAPTVPSRWLSRITNLLDGLKAQGGDKVLSTMRARGDHWLAMARALEDPSPVPPAARPSPVPPPEARPRLLSVTDVQKLIRDPYAIYARRVLGLRKLDPLAKVPDAALRGTIVHDVLEAFVRRTVSEPDALSVEPFMEMAREMLEREVPWPSARVLWLARLARVAPEFIAAEITRRETATPAVLEGKGTRHGTDPVFTLVGKADRIDIGPDGAAVIYDYKTGTPPKAKEQAYFDKQLLLEAAMLESGGFEGIDARQAKDAKYIGLGSKYEEVAAPLQDEPPTQVWAKLESLMQRYLSGKTGYTALRAIKSERMRGDFAQLARFGEWDASDPPYREDLT